jgi:hypothetical protein
MEFEMPHLVSWGFDQPYPGIGKPDGCLITSVKLMLCRRGCSEDVTIIGNELDRFMFLT